MRTLAGLVFFPLVLTVQMALVAQIRLLQGSADLMLLALLFWYLHDDLPHHGLWALFVGLLVGLASALPWPVPLVAYGFFGWLIRILRRRLWARTVLAAFTLLVLGTLITQGMAWAALRFLGRPIPWQEALRLVLFPSLLLNLFFALPMHALVDELAAWVAPRAQEALP